MRFGSSFIAREDLIVYGRSYGSFTKMPIPAGFHTPQAPDEAALDGV
jgi:hypothetical protein